MGTYYFAKIVPFIDVKIRHPIPFDLLELKYSNDSTKLGWWTGSIWDGLNVKKDDKIISWRKRVK